MGKTEATVDHIKALFTQILIEATIDLGCRQHEYLALT